MLYRELHFPFKIPWLSLLSIVQECYIYTDRIRNYIIIIFHLQKGQTPWIHKSLQIINEFLHFHTFRLQDHVLIAMHIFFTSHTIVNNLRLLELLWDSNNTEKIFKMFCFYQHYEMYSCNFTAVTKTDYTCTYSAAFFTSLIILQLSS